MASHLISAEKRKIELPIILTGFTTVLLAMSRMCPANMLAATAASPCLVLKP